MSNNNIKLCAKCNEKPIYIQKRSLCLMCYQRARKKHGGFPPIQKTPRIYMKHKENREMEFIKNYFTHHNWHYHPACFSLNSITDKYSPDFYDGEKNVFIEVSGSRQAYHENKKKYNLFRKIFPKIILEIRHPSGKIVNEDENKTRKPIKQWEQ